MFLPEGCAPELEKDISSDPDNLKDLNIFTYQLLSVACEDDEAFERLAENLWAEISAKAQGLNIEDAMLRISNMRVLIRKLTKRSFPNLLKSSEMASSMRWTCHFQKYCIRIQSD